MSPKSQRLQSVELLRLLSAFGVVIIHFWPRLEPSPQPLLDLLVVGSSRFAVPFFFVASGFFLRDRLGTLADGGAFAWRWIRILLAWHAIHAIWFTILHFTRYPDPWSRPPMWVQHLATWDAILEGVAWPLWYLHSLVLCALLASATPKAARAWLPALGAVFFLLGLAWGPWAIWRPDWMPPTPGIAINVRGFLFSGLLPFALGLSWATHPKRWSASAMVVSGLILQTIEIVATRTVFDHAVHQEFFLGSALLGVGLFRLALVWNPPILDRCRWGSASLPMYLAQLILFSLMSKPFETLTAPFLDPWSSSVVSLCLALPVYALVCHRIGLTTWWRRLHG